MKEPSEFDHRVWDEVRQIPWGETRTYGEIADALGSQAQPVGVALGHLRRFPDMDAIVPWHRVTLKGGWLEINDRTRGQVRSLVLEGHTITKSPEHFRVRS